MKNSFSERQQNLPVLAAPSPPLHLCVAGSLGVAAPLVAVVAAIVLAVADLVPLDAVVVGALEVGEDVGADLGPVGAERVVVLVAAVAAVVHAVAHQEARDALQLIMRRRFSK